MRQYNRAWSLTIERQDPASNTLTELGVVTNLRISFHVTQYLGAVGDSSQIRVYNLPASLRAIIARVPDFQNDMVSPPYDFVTLRAGYIDGNPLMEIPVIARGVVFTATNRRVGPDWVTDIVANGFLAQSIGAILDKSYEATPAVTVIVELLNAMGMDAPQTSAKAGQILADTIFDAITVTGNSAAELRRIVASLGLLMAADSGKIFLQSKTEGIATQRDPPYVYSEETGLIGVPEISKQGVKIRALLNTRTRMLSRFDVQSVSLEATLRKRINTYLSSEITYDGDTHGSSWFVDITGIYPTLWKTQANAEPPV